MHEQTQRPRARNTRPDRTGGFDWAGTAESILSDPEAANADVFKGLSLLFERIYQREGADGPLGDFEIRLKA
jgi:hypothetical protein